MHAGIEVTGRGVPAALEAFGEFTVLAGQMLMANGVGVPDKSGFIRVDLESWYPLEGYLKTIKDVEEQFGPKMLRKLGAAKAKHAVFPPHMVDITSAMQAVDVGYHMNHRQHGRPMFDPVNGQMLEGIGHYHYHQIPGKKRILMRCDNPYPCKFDEGLLEAMAWRFIPTAVLEHEPGSCRSKGGQNCTYAITW
ncbi:MAG TPA: hypothetical protein VNA24_25570 [Hyalangium sp.]|jgi:hypothetical protein|nr:hypothetical protein [Hyalangium sp.]